MNYDVQHRDYARMSPCWKLIRDVLEGEEAVKRKQVAYLPKPSGQDDEDYAAYLNRAMFYDATARTLDGYVGLVFRKKPSLVDESGALNEFIQDITMTGMSLDDIARICIKEVLSVGKFGILVEFPIVEGVRTVADTQEDGIRPYLTAYSAEDIVDWRETRIKGRKTLSYLKLHEVVEAPLASDMFETQLTEQYRVFYLDALGRCVYELWVHGNNGWAKSAIADPYLYINDKIIDFIPFVIVSPYATESRTQKPPLYDLAMANIHHYQVMADRIHAVHWADNPTPVIIGNLQGTQGQEVQTLKLGSATAINLGTGGDAKFLEVVGNGLQPTKELIADIAEYMSILGSKILTSDQAAAEAAETAAIHRAGEHSVLASIANTVANAITQALNLFIRFTGKNDTVTYRLNTDFYPSPMSSQDIIALVKALQVRAISTKEFYEALVAGEIIRSDKTFDEHQQEVSSDNNVVVEDTTVNELGGTTRPSEVTT